LIYQYHQKWLSLFHQEKVSNEYKNKLSNLARELGINEIAITIFDDIDKSKKFIEKYMTSKGYLHTNSLQYKIRHNTILRLGKVAFLLWRTQGINFLLTATKNKIKSVIKIP